MPEGKNVKTSTRNPIAEVTELLAKHEVDIRDIDFSQMGADSCLSLAVSDYDKGLELLMGAGYQVISNRSNRVRSLIYDVGFAMLVLLMN